MSTSLPNMQQAIPTIRERLAWAFELFGDSHADRFDARVERLEAEVERLLAFRPEPAKA